VFAAALLGSKALTALAALLAAAALPLAASGAGAWAAALLAGAAAAAYARERLAWWASWVFVSSKPRWHKKGGLTLVNGLGPLQL
jgi:hypothetical protein